MKNAEGQTPARANKQVTGTKTRKDKQKNGDVKEKAAGQGIRESKGDSTASVGVEGVPRSHIERNLTNPGRGWVSGAAAVAVEPSRSLLLCMLLLA